MNRKNNIKVLQDTLEMSQSDLGGKLDADRKSKRKKDFYSVEEIRIKIMADNLSAISRSFQKGSCYHIIEKNCYIDTPPPQLPILCYEGKEGIHHVFREIVGNWIVTYTDAQLVGKTIKEADRVANGQT